jgi:hypothetical protein
MGIFDFLTPKTDGFAYDPMRLPAGANPETDPVLNYDDLGRKIYTSRFDGTQYLFEMEPPKTQSVVKGAYREATANPLGFTGDLLSNAVQSAWDAISAPARSMAGEPITYGDIAGLTGMVTLGAGAGTAPAGALRMGAAREGRPPVTFADAERAMQETPGITAYHGSPHSFDKFQMSKIGTGEGAQAYGHGLYFAQNEGVAKSYKDMLGGRNTDYSDPVQLAASLVKLTGSKENALEHLALNDIWKYEAGPEAISLLKSGIDLPDQPKGNMYEVNINANPEDFINFDAPFEQQPPNVQKYFGYLARGERKPTGEDLARRMESNIYIQEAAQAGIPGIKYFDAGSRDKAYAVNLAYKGRPFEEGQFEPQFARSKEEADIIAKEYQDKGYDTKIQESGSRNFVVFDDKLISIVKKYGIAGAAVMLGTSADQISQTLTENMTQEELNNLVSGA